MIESTCLAFARMPVVEVSPPFDPSGTTGLTGAQMMFEILCLLAETVGKRKDA